MLGPQWGLVDTLAKIKEEALKAGCHTIITALPEELDEKMARKALEVALFDSCIKGEIIGKPTGQAKTAQRTIPDKTSFTIIPKEGISLADIVKGVQEKIDPASMGVKVHSLHETKSGGVQVTFQNNKAMPSAFFDKVQQCVASKGTCHQRKRSVIVQSIEATMTEDDILSTLANALDAPVTQLQAGKISNSQRGRSLVVTMSSDLVERALNIKHIPQCWTKAYIKEKIEPDFCGYCQAYGHQSRNCNTKIQQPRRCYNCGEAGHLRTSCEKPAACFSCQTTGHRGNSMACPTYRALVIAKRK